MHCLLPYHAPQIMKNRNPLAVTLTTFATPRISYPEHLMAPNSTELCRYRVPEQFAPPPCQSDNLLIIAFALLRRICSLDHHEKNDQGSSRSFGLRLLHGLRDLMAFEAAH